MSSQEDLYVLSGGKSDAVVCGRSVGIGDRKAEMIQHVLRKCIERHRVKSAGLVRRAALANPRGKVLSGIAFETDRKDALWCRTKTCLQEIGGLLRQKFGLARSGTGGNANTLRGLSKSVPDSRFKVIDALWSPIFRRDGHQSSAGSGTERSR